MSDWLTNNSGGSGNPGVAFDEIGAKVKGTIVGEPRQVDTEYGERLVIELVAAEGCTATKGPDRDPIAKGDETTLWVKPGAMARALKEALVEAGAPGLEEGATLALAYTADGEKKPGKNPPKLYKAAYERPKTAVAIGDDLL